MANIIDLFSGCGGMSLGFSMAGFKPILAIEKDAWLLKLIVIISMTLLL